MKSCFSQNLRQGLVCLLPAVLCFSISCSRKALDATTQQPQPTEVVSSSPPFKTREPQKYRGVRTTTIKLPSGETTTRDVFAKSGNLRRSEFNLRGQQKVVQLENSNGQFLLLPDEKVYADLREDPPGAPAPDDSFESETTPDRLLHADTMVSLYQKLGEEDLNGRRVTKYRVVVNTSPSGSVTNTDTIVWVDEALGIPVKFETTSNGSTNRVELSEISLEVEPAQFLIPVDYKKVSPGELRRKLKGNDQTSTIK